MKRLLLFVAALGLTGCQKDSDGGRGTTTLESERDRVSYAIGVNVGSNMIHDSVEFSPEPLLQGIKDAALDTSKRLMKPSEVEQTLMAYQQELSKKRAENARKAGEVNLKKGQEWLAENAKKEGVITLPSGLQYKVIKQGNGPRPKKDQVVVAHYKGTLINGSKFDSSFDRGEPSEFQLSGVIPGWTEGLQLMSVGSKWELYIPPGLAYGEAGAGPIGPNETLVFEVELLSIK